MTTRSVMKYRAYRFTPGRRIALHKAQLASARKRMGSHRLSPSTKRKIAIGAGVGVGVLAVGAGAGIIYGNKVLKGGPRAHKRIVGRQNPRNVPSLNPNLSGPRRSVAHVTAQASKRPTQTTHRANPHEDVVVAARQIGIVIGSVRTAHRASPHVDLGPIKLSKPNKRGDIRVTRRTNR